MTLSGPGLAEQQLDHEAIPSGKQKRPDFSGLFARARLQR
jgi:hypothetical protein